LDFWDGSVGDLFSKLAGRISFFKMSHYPRLWSLRGILTSRSHPSSAEEGSRAHPNVFAKVESSAAEEGEPQYLFTEMGNRESFRSHFL
jgi:hypothetical protein